MGSTSEVGTLTSEGPFKSQQFDRDGFQDWILRRLGAPIWKVELTCDHIDEAIDEAIRWFAAKKGVFKFGEIQIQPGVVQYQLADEVDIVIDVAFAAPESDISLIFSPFLILDEKVPYDVFAAPQSIGLYSSYTQTLQYIEQAKRILGAELDWEQRGRCLFVSPTPRQAAKAVLEVKSSKFNYNELPERDAYLIREYAKAHAMRDLGFIRTKYSSFPGAQGDMSLNGERLIDTANELIEKLNEEIMLTGYPMKFSTG